MRYSFAGGLLRKTQTKISKLAVVSMVTGLVLGGGLSLSLYKTVFATPGVYPSTNDANRLNSWAHADLISQTEHSVTLKFISTRAFTSCFEYRTDGDTSQILTENSGNNYNSEVTDGLYPYVCVNNNTSTKTIEANNYAEIRLAFGAEKDERFDWTRFDIPQPPTAPTNLTFAQGTKSLACNGSGGTNVTASGTLHWTAPAGSIQQYIINPHYPDNSGQYTFYPPGSATSAWVTGNFPTHGEGVYSWTIKAKGTNGLVGPAATCSVIYDKHSPTAYFTGTVPQYVNGNFTVSGAANDNVKLKDVFFDVRDSSGWVAGCVAGTLDQHYTNEQKDAAPACTINTANLVDGQTYTLRIHASDYAGYGGGESRSLTIDRTAPTGSATYTGGNKVGGVIYLKTINDLKYSASLNDSVGLDQSSFVVFKLDSAGHHISGMFCGNWHNSSSTEHLSGTSANISDVSVSKCSWYQGLGSWTEGTYEIAHRVYDLAGNFGSFNSPTQKFVIDNTRPSITFTNPSDFDNSTYNQYFQTGPNLAISASDTNGIATTVLHVYNADNSPAKFCPVSNSDTTTCDTSSLPDGNYYVKAGATDNAGNNQTITKYFTIDSTRPSAHISSPADNSYIASPDFTISGTASDGLSGIDHVNIYVSKVTPPDANGKTFGGYVVDNQPANYSSGSFTYDATGIADGVYVIKAVAYDKAGNAHFANTVHTTVDTTTPDVTDNFNISMFTGDKVILAPTVTDDTNVVYSWVVSDTKLPNDPNDPLNGTTLKIGPAPKGNYTVDLTVTDQAGNSTTKHYSVTISVGVNPGLGAGPNNSQRTNNTTFAATTPVVLGAFTANDGSGSSGNDENSGDGQGQVQGEQTSGPNNLNFANTTNTENASGFLGLGWWWLAILVVVLGALYWLLARRSTDDQ